MGDKSDELKAARVYATHFVFSVENADECIRLLSAYKKEQSINTPHRRIGKR